MPRSGKSTLSQRLSHQIGYPQHISMDSVIAGIESVFPETGIDSGAHTDLRENIRYISSRMAPFLRARIDSGEYDECDYGMVIDTSYDREQVFLADTGFFICPLAISGGRLYNGE